MPNTDYIEKSLKIFEALDIKKIYYIDDDLEITNIPSSSDIIGILTPELLSEKKDAIKSFVPTLVATSLDLAKRSINSFLSDKEQQEQNSLLESLGALLGVEVATPSNDQAEFLKNTFNQHLGVFCIGPKSWARDKNTILSDAQPDNRVLCVFDQNLDNNDSTSSHTGRKGTNLISDITSRDNSGRIFCVIISNDIQIDNEIEHWREYVDTYGLPSSKFFPLSKNRTTDEKLFAEGIQLSSLNALYDLLKIETISIISNAFKASEKYLNQINLYNLNYMVANSKKAKEEGIWQASTLFRLYDIVQSESLKSQMIIDNYATFFNTNIDKVQAINKILPFPVDAISSERYELRYKELYESAENINKIHEELKIGDLFRSIVDAQTTRDYVLLAQPCDLTVRGETGVRNATVVTMAPISVMDKKKYEEKKKKSPGLIKTGFPLEYYHNGSDEVGFVEFNNAFSVSISILDLAVLSPNGQCLIDFSSDLVCPPQLHSAWRLRFNVLKAELISLHKQVSDIKEISDKLSKSLPDEAAFVLTLLPKPYICLSNGTEKILPQHSYNGTILNYNLQRIGSIRPPVSAHLLDAYTKHLSRVAYDHDFSS